MLTAHTIEEYTEKLGSDAPAPGGGSAAALVGALGAALGEMVGSFTVGKEKYADVEEEVSEVLDTLTDLRRQLLDLTNRDADAYSQVRDAYGMPSETETEKQERARAIQKALQAAAQVPAEVVRCCQEVVQQLPVLVEKGNPNLVSDAGVAAKLATAAAESAWLNVEINLAYMKDETVIENLRKPVENALEQMRPVAEQVWDDTVDQIVS